MAAKAANDEVRKLQRRARRRGGGGGGGLYKDMDRKQDAGHFFCLLNIDAFMELGEFRGRMDETIDRLKSGRRRPGVDEILVPGEGSARRAVANRAAGLVLTEETLKELMHWTGYFGLPFRLTPLEA